MAAAGLLVGEVAQDLTQGLDSVHGCSGAHAHMQLLELSEHEVECIPELVQLGDDTVLVLLLVVALLP